MNRFHQEKTILLVPVLGLFLFFSPNPLNGQISGEVTGLGPRGIAMGNAMAAVSGEGVYGYDNPAHAAAMAGLKQLDVSTAIMEFDRFSPSIDYTFAEGTNRVANLHAFALRLLL